MLLNEFRPFIERTSLDFDLASHRILITTTILVQIYIYILLYIYDSVQTANGDLETLGWLSQSALALCVDLGMV